MRSPWKAVPILAALVAAGCGGKDAPPPGEHVVEITWDRNRESSVNAPGGGYQVAIGGYPPLDVPYVSSLLAPTSITTTLWTGTYTVSVRAYGFGPDGHTPVASAPTQTTVRVP